MQVAVVVFRHVDYNIKFVSVRTFYYYIPPCIALSPRDMHRTYGDGICTILDLQMGI